MADGLTFGNSVMSDLMLGTLMPGIPRDEMGKVPTRVTLEVVVDFTDEICSRCAQYLGPGYMTDLLTSLRHGDACI